MANGQTRSGVQSDDFLNAFDECIRLVFYVVSRDLKEHGFNGGGSASSSEVVSMPLASLLPKIKACTERLLPGNLERNVVALDTLRSISSGPHCESLCMSIFDKD